MPGFNQGWFQKFIYHPFVGFHMMPFWQYFQPSCKFFQVKDMVPEVGGSLRCLFLKIEAHIGFWEWNIRHAVAASKALFLSANFCIPRPHLFSGFVIADHLTKFNFLWDCIVPQRKSFSYLSNFLMT